MDNITLFALDSDLKALLHRLTLIYSRGLEGFSLEGKMSTTTIDRSHN